MLGLTLEDSLALGEVLGEMDGLVLGDTLGLADSLAAIF